MHFKLTRANLQFSDFNVINCLRMSEQSEKIDEWKCDKCNDTQGVDPSSNVKNSSYLKTLSSDSKFISCNFFNLEEIQLKYMICMLNNFQYLILIDL